MIALLLVSSVGGLGAVLRFVIDSVIRQHVRVRYPLGTLVINATGSLLLGLVTGLALGQMLSEPWRLVLGVGFLGGYTTFSTASVECVRLVQDRQWLAALVHAWGMLVLSCLLAVFGLYAGLQL